MRKSRLAVLLVLALGVYAYLAPVYLHNTIFDPNSGILNWGLLVMLFFVLTIVAFFLEFEATADSAKQVALVSMLGTISAVSRLPFAPMMNFQPCSFFIICTGYVFGPTAGFMVAALTPLISNLFLGHGPWTVYQIFTWGLMGASAGYLGKLPVKSMKARIVMLTVFGGVWGMLYGLIIDVWYWASFIYPLTIKTYLLTVLNSVWWDSTHILANVVFMLVFGARVIGILERFRTRFFWEYTGNNRDEGMVRISSDSA